MIELNDEQRRALVKLVRRYLERLEAIAGVVEELGEYIESVARTAPTEMPLRLDPDAVLEYVDQLRAALEQGSGCPPDCSEETPCAACAAPRVCDECGHEHDRVMCCDCAEGLYAGTHQPIPEPEGGELKAWHEVVAHMRRYADELAAERGPRPFSETVALLREWATCLESLPRRSAEVAEVERWLRYRAARMTVGPRNLSPPTASELRFQADKLAGGAPGKVTDPVIRCVHCRQPMAYNEGPRGTFDAEPCDCQDGSTPAEPSQDAGKALTELKGSLAYWAIQWANHTASEVDKGLEDMKAMVRRLQPGQAKAHGPCANCSEVRELVCCADCHVAIGAELERLCELPDELTAQMDQVEKLQRKHDIDRAALEAWAREIGAERKRWERLVLGVAGEVSGAIAAGMAEGLSRSASTPSE